MSALPPKADICSAHTQVCFGPIADIAASIISSAASASREVGTFITSLFLD